MASRRAVLHEECTLIGDALRAHLEETPRQPGDGLLRVAIEDFIPFCEEAADEGGIRIQ